uniref:Uncharacterized protein n=1 Tax=Mycena chlorophos TaxID=658473 RepID=A0ABQ0LPI0_MYCCL|nr:predicted protein [Mycena chlorophos]
MCSLRIFLALFCLLAALANALPTPSPMASPRSLLGMRYVYSANYPPPDPKDALLKSLRIVPRQATLDRGARFERRMVLAKTNAPPMTIANNNMLSHQQLVPPPQPTPTPSPSPVPSVPTAPLAVPSSSSVAPTPSPGSRESKPKKHHVKLKKTTATKPKPSHVSQE